MKLKDLLPIISEYTRLILREAYTGKNLETCDGKEGLSGKYDDCNIYTIHGGTEGIICYIYPENAKTEVLTASEKEKRNILVDTLLSFTL